MTEVRTTSSTGGEKGTKPARFDLIPARALWKVAELFGFGAGKYSERNWERGYEWSKSFAAMMRHAWSFWMGEDIDPETKLPHLASVVFHAMAMMTWGETHPEFDDRPKSSLVKQFKAAVAERMAVSQEQTETNRAATATGLQQDPNTDIDGPFDWRWCPICGRSANDKQYDPTRGTEVCSECFEKGQVK